MSGGNFVPCLPGEVPVPVVPRYEMRVYDSLPPELRKAIAESEQKVRPSTVARFLPSLDAGAIAGLIKENDARVRPIYEAHCLAEAERVAISMKRRMRHAG